MRSVKNWALANTCTETDEGTVVGPVHRSTLAPSTIQGVTMNGEDAKYAWRNEGRLQRHGFVRLHSNSFMDEVRVKAMIPRDAGNRSVGLSALLDNLGLD